VDIPEKRVFEGIIDTLERTILPEVQTKYSKGQVMAIILLLKDLVAKREIRAQVLPRDISSLKELFLEILNSLEAEKAFAQDRPLSAFKQDIQLQLKAEGVPDQPDNLDLEDLQLNKLLESAIFILAEAEKRYRDCALERIRGIRKNIRQFLRYQFEMKKDLTGNIPMDLLSKT
jgi:hypothetical protein